MSTRDNEPGVERCKNCPSLKMKRTKAATEKKGRAGERSRENTAVAAIAKLTLARMNVSIIVTHRHKEKFYAAPIVDNVIPSQGMGVLPFPFVYQDDQPEFQALPLDISSRTDFLLHEDKVGDGET